MTKRHSHSTIQLDFVEGDTLPSLDAELLQDDDTTPQDITNWTITLHVKYRGQPLVKTADIYDPVNGKFRFTWDEADLKKGEYLAEIQFNSPQGIQTANSDAADNLLLFNISNQIA